MHSTESNTNILRFPLDRVLASHAQVRLLRVLLKEVSQPLSVSDAARLTGLTAPGARNALHRLEELGVAQRVGTGRAQKYGLRDEYELIGVLRQLFSEERRAYDDLISGLRRAVEFNQVIAAWIDELPCELSKPLHLSLVVPAASSGSINDALRRRLLELEKRFDLIIEFALFTKADEVTLSEDDILLWGAMEAIDSSGARAIQTHEQVDLRALQVSQAVAKELTSNPSLIPRAARHVELLLSEGQGMADKDLEEWAQVLSTYSTERVRDLLMSDTPRAARLRQSSPFSAVLTREERAKYVTGGKHK